jgi:hypothetical protein
MVMEGNYREAMNYANSWFLLSEVLITLYYVYHMLPEVIIPDAVMLSALLALHVSWHMFLKQTYDNRDGRQDEYSMDFTTSGSDDVHTTRNDNQLALYQVSAPDDRSNPRRGGMVRPMHAHL